MKKIILALLFLCCGFIYAETRTFKVTEGYSFGFDESKKNFGCSSKCITAILPCENGFVMKFVDIAKKSEDGKSFEYYIYKGFEFYKSELQYGQMLFYKCTIIDIKPNEFTVELEEIKD